MKNGLALFLSVQFLCASWLLAADPIGAVESAQGTVHAEGSDGLPRVLAEGSPVFAGDKVLTGSGAKVKIRFADQSVIGQGEQSAMVIDEYVYAPAEREENGATFRLFKGLFRVVTDQITRLNPDRFSVKTNYGTIGIRGCDLGFTLLDEHEDIAVIGLHHADSVVVSMRNENGSMETVVVTEDGLLVTYSPSEGISQRPLQAGDLEGLDDVMLIAPLGLRETASGQGAPTAMALGENGTPSYRTDSEGGAPMRVDVLSSAAARDPDGSLEDPDAGGQEEVVASSPPPTRAPKTSDPVYPIIGPKETVARGSGADWSWSLWQQSITDLDAGTPVTTITAGSSARGPHLGVGNFTALAEGATAYNLTGTGSAGALVTMADQARVLNGLATLNVRVGRGLPATWSGQFDLSSGTDALNFNAAGDITDGSLNFTGTPLSYSLDAFGASYARPDSSQISGHLVGTGNGDPPISGAVVEFGFDHGPGGPRVRGAGGADF